MNSELTTELILCGLLLTGLSLLAKYLEPALSSMTFITGLTGGGLCILWGLLDQHVRRSRLGAKITLPLLACVLLRQAVQSWRISFEDESQGRPVAVVMTVLVVFCVGTWVKVMQARKMAES